MRYVRAVPSDWVKLVWWLAPPGGDCAAGRAFPQPALPAARAGQRKAARSTSCFSIGDVILLAAEVFCWLTGEQGSQKPLYTGSPNLVAHVRRRWTLAFVIQSARIQRKA